MATKTIHPKETSESLIARNKRAIDRNVRTLMAEMEHENTLVAETRESIINRALKIYRGLRPMLALISTLPILPSSWRAALVMHTQSLDALTTAPPETATLVAPDAGDEFKAGKDL